MGAGAYSPPGSGGYSGRQTWTAPRRHRVGHAATAAAHAPARKAFLVTHVTVSAGRLGTSLCLLAPALASVRNPDAFAEVSVSSVGTGLVPMGYAEFWLTLAADAQAALSLRPGRADAASTVFSGGSPPRPGCRDGVCRRRIRVRAGNFALH